MAQSNFSWQNPQDWIPGSESLAEVLHARHRWRLPLLLAGMLFAQGRRTVTTWLRAAGISDDYQDYYYFLSSLGQQTRLVAMQLLFLVLRGVPLPSLVIAVMDDSPTKRYGKHVKERRSITTLHQARPINNIYMDTFGPRCRWRFGIRLGAR